MPYNRPGAMRYAVATKTTWHADPACEGGSDGLASVGTAVKTKAVSSGAAAGTPQHQIAIGEPFSIIAKGVVVIRQALLSSPAVGDKLYITAATNVLTKGSGDAKFGRIIELAGTRGCPTGFFRVDLDAKDSF